MRFCTWEDVRNELIGSRERAALEHVKFLLEESNPGVMSGYPKLQPTDAELALRDILNLLRVS